MLYTLSMYDPDEGDGELVQHCILPRTKTMMIVGLRKYDQVFTLSGPRYCSAESLN